MAKRSKKPADLNRLAAAIVGDATDQGSAKLNRQRRAKSRGGQKEASRPNAEK